MLKQTDRLTYHTFLDYPHGTFISTGVIVPQAVYNADLYHNISTSLARPRFEPLPPVRFREDEELGFSLQDALDYRFDRLHDYGSMPFLSDSASRISCRILVSSFPKTWRIRCHSQRFPHSGQATKHGLRAFTFLITIGIV